MMINTWNLNNLSYDDGSTELALLYLPIEPPLLYMPVELPYEIKPVEEDAK